MTKWLKSVCSVVIGVALSGCTLNDEEGSAPPSTADAVAEKTQAQVGDACATDTDCAADFCATYTCNTTTSKCELAAAQNVGTGCEPNGGNPTVGCTNTCTAAGTCSGAAITCTGDFCSDSACSTATGQCATTTNGAHDGLGCHPSGTAGCLKTCVSGACTGPAPTCTGDFCSTSACDATDGTCKDTAQNNGKGCEPNGGNPTVGCSATCAAGACSGPALTCTGDFCSTSACDATSGACKDTAQNVGKGCEPNGGNPTVGCSASCAADGTCSGVSKTTSCTGQTDFCKSLSCDAATGNCTTPTALNDGVGCDDSSGKALVGCAKTCSAGSCTGTSKTTLCDASLDSFCRNGSCNAGTGLCTSVAQNTGTGCNGAATPAVGCAGICQADGSCDVALTKSSQCFGVATGNTCTYNDCAPATGTCVVANRDSSTSCNDNASCTTGNSYCENSFCRYGENGGDDANCDAGRPACGVSDCRAATSSNPTAGCYYAPAGNSVPCTPATTTSCTQLTTTCDGTSLTCPAAPFLAQNTPCRGAAASTCNATTGVITFQQLCNATGTCQAATVTNCAPYGCNGSFACKTSCANDTDCASTAYCNANVCTPKGANGAACTATNQCTTGICSIPDGGPGATEGVCCNATCNGACETCATGTCLAVPSGGQPQGQRTACVAHPICGGSCNGTNRASCTYSANGSVCDAAECTVDGSTGEEFFQAQITCNNGSCAGENSPSSCGGSVCDLGLAPPGCVGGCLADQDCIATSYCKTPGAPCVPKEVQGAACTSDNQCQSGLSCTDGVCCNSKCSGLCEACNVAGSVGTCSATPAGTQPIGTRPDCSGTGTCAGACDGTNHFSCKFPDQATSCGAASCSGGTATPAGTCDGGGNCATGTPVSCAPGACSGTACDGDCSACTATQYCVANRCVERLTNGGACVKGDDCQSGNCIDGVCCDTTCDGQCAACNVAGSLGTCSPVPTGGSPVGARPGCATDGSTCGGTCDGTTLDSCAYPDAATSCGAASCTTGARSLATLERTCLGNGSCSAPDSQICPGACDVTDTFCDGGCVVDADCTAVPGQYCHGGVCTDAIADGGACATDTQCENGHCIDGVCCDTVCNGACQECGTGTCAFRTGQPLPGRPACAGSGSCGGQCDGTAATCSFPDATVACGGASCQGGFAVPASTCNGTGACSTSAGSVCPGGLLCSGGICATTCSADSDCASGLTCQNGACKTPPPPATGGATGAGGSTGSTGGSAGSTGGSTSSSGGTTGMGGEDGSIDGIDEGTCGCSTPGIDRVQDGRLWAVAGAFLLVALARRRRAA